MDNAYTSWIDIPVIEAIEYFSGCLKTFYRWTNRYALIIGTIGLCWSAFRLINSRMTIRELWWDTLYKWLLFLLMMAIYPVFTLGLSAIGNRIGVDAGGGKTAIINSLTSMKKAIEDDLQTQQKLLDNLQVEISSELEGFTYETDFGNVQDYNEYLDMVTNQIVFSRFDSKSAKKRAFEKIAEYRNKNKYKTIFGAKTLAAIKDILVPAQPDGTDGSPLTDSYVDLNIWLKDSKGTDSYYLSPAAILRITLLGCQVMWDKNQMVYAKKIDDIEEQDMNFISENFEKIGTTFGHIPNWIMTIISCVVLICCTIFAEIQYIMTILEYTIITGIGAVFIPFILFDGTKDLPKKLVPVCIGFLIKMMVMTICMFYVFYLFIETTIDIMRDSGGVNLISFATLFFNGLICFILTQNAPKIAMTLMTGQPQLSMGEFVQAVGSVTLGSRLTARNARAAGRTAKDVSRKALQTGINVKGEVTKMSQAAKTAGASIIDHGGTEQQAMKAGLKGMFASFTGDIKDKLKNAGSNFLHGSGGKGSPGHGGGAQAHQRSGQNTSRELGAEESRTLNTTSNPKFQNATKFDETTQSNVNMTRKEFYDEKREQGNRIGNAVAQKMMAAAEKKQQAQEKDTALDDRLTDGTRAS